MMFQKCLFFNLYNIIINNKRRQNCEVSRMFLVCLLFWRMIFLSLLLLLLRLFVLKATQRPSLPGGTTWGRHRTTRVSPPGCMFLSVFTLYSRSICKSSDTRRLTESTKQNMKPRSETGRGAKVEGFKEKQSRFSPVPVQSRDMKLLQTGWRLVYRAELDLQVLEVASW